MSSKDIQLQSADDLTMKITSDQNIAIDLPNFTDPKVVNLGLINLGLINLEREAFRRAIEYMKTVPCANAANAEPFDPTIDY